MSSLTVIFGYIASCLFLYLFFHYKFLKILNICTLFWLRQNAPAKGATTYANAKSPSSDDNSTAVPMVPVRAKTVWDIPGPAVWPLFGTKWIFLWKYSMAQLHKVYAEFARTYGSIVLEVTPSGVPIVLLFDRADIEKVLRYPSRYPFRPPTDIVSIYRKRRSDRYASVGITNEQGPCWQHLRNKLTPAIISTRVLQAFLPALNEICDDFVELLRTKRCPITGILQNFQDEANLMGLEAVCMLMMGRRMGFLSAEPDSDVLRLAAAVKRLFATQRDSTFGFGLWRYVRTRTWREFSESEELIYKIISDIVDPEIAAILQEQALGGNGGGGNGGDNNDAGGIRSVFLSILGEKDLDTREKKSAIIDFISAGIETLANTLSFILYYVSQDGSTQERIYSEFGHCHKQMDTNDLAGATFTKACVSETYRLSPTAFCLARILEEDTTLSGYELKTGTVVLCQTMLACNSDKNFTEAQQFRPQRWLDGQPDAASLVVPFGIGRRTCPGRRFVEMELTLLLAKMVRQFDISYCGELQTEFEFLLVPRTPVGLRLRDRVAPVPHPAQPTQPTTTTPRA